MSPESKAGSSDSELEIVREKVLTLDPDGIRISRVLRRTLDQLYDGQRTGRYRWDELYKTEKTHCGTLVEINLHREFEFENGSILDYKIGGIEVDCKYSQKAGSWTIPPEALGHLCLLVTADDQASKWSIGLLRIQTEYLNEGRNRDKKATLNEAGRRAILHLHKEAPLPPNVLLQLDRTVVDRVMNLKSGQQKITEIFRVAQGRIISRNVIATLGQQDDFMKRLRQNGGARSKLQAEGILILGQYKSHQAVAEIFGLPIPANGESVSVRVASVEKRGDRVAEIAGKYWRVATAQDAVEEAPILTTA